LERVRSRRHSHSNLGIEQYFILAKTSLSGAFLAFTKNAVQSDCVLKFTTLVLKSCTRVLQFATAVLKSCTRVLKLTTAVLTCSTAVLRLCTRVLKFSTAVLKSRTRVLKWRTRAHLNCTSFFLSLRFKTRTN
jgi:hypothetical protein